MKTTLISGFARSFVSGMPISDGTVTVIENQELSLKTDKDGKFGPFEWPVQQPITLVFEKPGSFWSGYRATQTATIFVPPEGINNNNFLKNISFQVPSNLAFKVISLAMGEREDSQACQIATTVTPSGTTLDNIPQGIANVKVSLSPEVSARVFYFDIFPIIHKTNPFIRKLESTSLDGGALFVNVPEGEYTLEAKKDGITFSKVHIKARKGTLVNASPPFCPVQQNGGTHLIEKKPNHYGFFKPLLTVGLSALAMYAVNCSI